MTGNSILVIDDSTTNLVLLESLLEKNGYNVASAMNAMEGLELIKSKIPDLILLDFLMPGIDGIEFIGLLKENDSWRDIPVIILSAISDADVIRRSIEAGARDYITKPINIHKIIELAKDILSN